MTETPSMSVTRQGSSSATRRPRTVPARARAAVGVSWGIVALAVAALTACSGQPNATTSASAVPSTTVASVTPTPTSTLLSTEQAGQRYLDIVGPPNAACAGASWTADTPADQIRSAATTCADGLRTFADALVATPWPADVQPTVDALVSEVASEIATMREIAATTTDEQLAAATQQLNSVSNTAAQKLRILLGLDDVPVASSTATP